MAATTTVITTEAALEAAAEVYQDLGRSEAQSRLPEGRFKLFLMDFKFAGTAGEYYPAILKPLGTGGRAKSKNYTATDYLPFRFAVGRARDYILDAFGIPSFDNPDQLPDSLDVNFLQETAYFRLKKNGGAITDPSTANWNPETKAILIKTGKPFRVGIAGGITQTGINDQNIAIRGPVALRVPTVVSAFQFSAWLSRDTNIQNRNKMTALYLAGGRKVPITGGGDPVEMNRDGAD